MATGLQAGATDAAESADDVAALLRDLTHDLGADVVIDAAGVSAALKSALAWVRPGGQIAKVGWGAQPIDFSLDPLVRKAVTLTGSFSHTWAVWERVLAMLGTGQLDPRPYLSRVSPMADWRASFEGMHAGDLIKPVLVP
jgi:alcohol dehydrogenase/L-iditol 2-dehydrogenase